MKEQVLPWYRVRYNLQVRYAQGYKNHLQLIQGNPFQDWTITDLCVPWNEVEILAPVEPSKIIAVGLNYRSHALELGMALPQEPLIFLKPPTALANPEEAIAYPPSSQRVDFEGELAVVIGRKAKHVPVQQAHEFIFGYTLANDITARDLQNRDGQWTRAKGFDGFCPLGPCVRTALDFESFEFFTRLNGELKQTGRLSDMIFSIPRIVSFVSEVMTLWPGDVILTGTPPGVGSMQPGDCVTVESTALGSLVNRIRQTHTTDTLRTSA